MSWHRPIVVAAATPIELRAFVAPLVENLPPLPKEGESVTIRAAGKGVALLVTGIGPLNAAYSLGRALGDGGRFQGVINVGIAGSYDCQQLPLGAVAVASEEYFPDYGAQFEDRVEHEAVGLAQAKGPEGGVWERISLYPRAAAEALSLAPQAREALEEIPQVPFLTSGLVSGSPEVGQARKERHGVLVENMEGFALALGSLRAEMPFLEIRAISNPCGTGDKEQWDKRTALNALGKWGKNLLGW